MPPLVIPVAFDFTCPQVWIGWHQTRRLRREYEVEFEWRPYELWPEELPWPDVRPEAQPPGKVPVPSRLDLQLMLENVERPLESRPKMLRVHYALEAAAFLRENAPEEVDSFVGRVMEAYWVQGEKISELEVVMSLAPAVDGLREALSSRSYKERVVHFNADAYKSGVWNVPTFFIGDEKLAEPPYSALAAEIERHLGIERTLYRGLVAGSREDRPYVFIDMVATIDGKILSGERDEHVIDLGSAFDHRVMKSLEGQADAVLVGAGTLRASKPTWSPQASKRIVVSTNGNFDYSHQFFSRGAVVVTPASTQINAPEPVRHQQFEGTEVPLDKLLSSLKKEGVNKLLVLGGSTLNAQLVEQQLVDELFLTIAPKIKLGKNVPTYADGNPLPRERLQHFHLVEHHRVGDEMFLRYRREF